MQALARPLKWPPIFPLEKGLVLWLPFDDRSGARAQDRSGKRNHGALYGPTWVAGRRGSALSFNGVGDYVEGLFPFYLTEWTLLIWVYPLSIPATGADRYFCAYRSTDTLMLTQHSSASLGFYVSGYSGARIAENYFSTTRIKTQAEDVWIHFGVTYKANVLIGAYVDGKYVAGGTVKGALTLENYRVGRDDGALYGDAVIGGVTFLSRALNAAEIKRYYESEIMLARW